MNHTSGSPPLAVQFNDTSQYAPTAWNWSFDDGTFSEEQNPQHLFVVENIYHIYLNVSNVFGFNTSMKTLYVTNMSSGGSSGSSTSTPWIDFNTLMAFSAMTVPAVMIMIYLLFVNRKKKE
jgi:PKD repeat protein